MFVAHCTAHVAHPVLDPPCIALPQFPLLVPSYPAQLPAQLPWTSAPCPLLPFPTGKVLNPAPHQLCPPGLVFGCTGEKLVDEHISQALPSAVGRLDQLLKDPKVVGVKGALKVRIRGQTVLLAVVMSRV